MGGYIIKCFPIEIIHTRWYPITINKIINQYIYPY